MEVKVQNIEANSIGEVMGLTKKEMHELASRTAKHYITYFKSVMEDDDNKLTDNNIAENKLFFSLIKECENIEQVIFISMNFKATVNAVLAHGLKQMIEAR